MRWFWHIVDLWAAGKQQKEMTAFVEIMRSMDGPELGPVVALATHWRHALENLGHNVMNPMLYATLNPGFAIFLSKSIAELQKQGQPQSAAGLMVWLHTIRACLRPSLRGHAREMWGQLSRGFPYVEAAAVSARELLDITVNIEHAAQFPIGYTPIPL